MAKRAWRIRAMAGCLLAAGFIAAGAGSANAAPGADTGETGRQATTGVYYLKAYGGGCLDADDDLDGYVFVRNCNGGEYQRWHRVIPLWESDNQRGWCMQAPKWGPPGQLWSVFKRKCNRSDPFQAWRYVDKGFGQGEWRNQGWENLHKRAMCLYSPKIGNHATIVDCNPTLDDLWTSQRAT